MKRAIALLLAASAAPALSQSAPPFRNLDANGVDLVLGDFVMSFPEGSIGSGDAELKLIRRNAASAATPWDRISFLRQVTGSTATITIRRDTFSDTFTGNVLATSFTSPKANGSTLTGSGGFYTYTGPDGATISFTNPIGEDSPSNFCSDIYPSNSCDLQPTSLSDPDGNAVSLEWDLIFYGGFPPFYQSRLASVSNTFGYKIAFNYSTGGERTGASFINTNVSTSPQGSVSYAYPASGTVDVTDMAGKVWRLTATSIKRPTETTPGFTVSGIYPVTSVTRDGVTTGYARSVSGTTVTMAVTQPLSGSTTIVSNAAVGRPSSVTDALGRTMSYQYDANKRLTRITAPEGNYVQYTLDARGNATQTRQVAKAGSGLADIVTAATYPSICTNPITCNRPTSTTDAKGYTTDYTYSAVHGGVETVTLPAPTSGAVRPQTRYSYTTVGGVSQLTGISRCIAGASCTGTANEVVTTATYDAAGNAISTSNGAGDGSLTATVMATYDALGDLASVDGPLSGTPDTTVYRYDAARRPVGVIGPDPDAAGALKNRAARVTYNDAGQPTRTETGTTNGQSNSDWTAFAPLQAVASTYDANARKATDAVQAGGTTFALTQYSYDARGRPECTAVRMNAGAFGSLPSSACTLGTAGPSGDDRISKTIYDAANQATKTQTAVGTADVADEATLTYTTNGRLSTLADGNNNRTTYEYDGFDRVTKTRYPSSTTPGTSSTTDYEQSTYDANSNVVSRRLRDAQSISYTYDNLNRLTAKDRPNSVYWETDKSYAYDLLGRTTQASDSNGHQLSFGYDALGRQISLGDNWYTYGNMSFQYDLAGRRTRSTWNDGFYAQYDYFVTGEVLAIRENGATSGVGVLGTYTYDNLGRRTALYRGNATETDYTYDAVSRLTTLTNNLGATAHDVTTTFSYNPAAQIASSTRDNDAYAWTGHYNVDRPYTVNGLNQLTAAGSTTLGYDGRGNLTTSGSSSYGYTSENELATAPSITGLAYDPLGRLFNFNAESGINTTFNYDGVMLTGETNQATGALLRRYVYGPGTDEVLVWYEGSGTTDRRWLYQDERGSVTAMANASGNATALNSYDEYGIPASGNVGRFGYTGQAWLPALGMWYYKARMYSPTLGRFMQTDPIGYGGGMNLYAYVGGDPVNMVDPLGLHDNEITVTGRRIMRTSGADLLLLFARAGFVASALADSDRGSDSSQPYCGGSGCPDADDIITVTAQPQKTLQNDDDDIVVTALKKVGQCALDQYGLGALGAGLTAAGQPIPGTKPFVTPGSSKGTSLAGMAADAVFGKARSPVRLPTVVGSFPKFLTGRTLGIAGTKSVARFAGRAVPVIGEALLAYDAISIAVCAATSD